ncbi:MAG: hypothetical protein NTV22_11455 [bacterium]|nr:hypothetical protein [bacterium]
MKNETQQKKKRPSWDEKRVSYIEAGRENLPMGALDGLSEKQVGFYLSLRGQYREELHRLLKLHEDRLHAAYDTKPQTLATLRAQMMHALVRLMRLYDGVDKRSIMAMTVHDVGGLILLGLTEAAKWLEELR